ncbi:4'-phosphopantetheinyl transferase superfamily protein [Zunongwangia sp. F363]|uniref:4'-phosphopantetheinyl transferase superfamily protein n=1 Tax=Autumnicola tepida TaxID=3075595 RepID=A0ABU3C665_9FLAO|nr:4'-phosphopantetheinyl transferase superfamily protein [Zunongwangia sp. F363]MDT0641831.1 4'-phosphopantetheinyl transferase superfamily protein [Zunongwangia sp. F363]
MIGNDIVDLKLSATESNIYRPRLQEKIFSEEERVIIRTSENPETQLWLFWAMKEAAYKAHQRRFNLPRRFNPKDFKCRCEISEKSELSGTVHIQGFEYFSSSKISAEYIHCIASASASAERIYEIFSIKEKLKKELISAFSERYNFTSGAVQLLKNNYRIPQLYCDGEYLKHSFSLSHHGRFSAYVLAVN